MFTFGSDRSRRGGAGRWRGPCRSRRGGVGGGEWLLGPEWAWESRRLVGCAVWAVLGGGGGGRSGRRVRGADQVLGGLAVAFAVFGWEPERGAALVLGLAGGEGVVDPEVAGDE